MHAGQLFVPEFCCRLFVVSFECEGQQWLMLKAALSRVESCGSLPMQIVLLSCPTQAYSPQGASSGNGMPLVDNELRIGPGW